MADFNDPVAQALQQRAGYPSPQGMTGQDYLNAVAPYTQAPAPVASQGAMGGSVSVPAMGGTDSGSAKFGYNPKTKQLLVNGHVVPADFSLWRHAAALPDDQLQSMPRSAIFDAGFQPVDKANLQALIQHIDDNAQSHRMGDIGTNLWQGAKDVVGGAVRELSRFPQMVENTPMGQAGAQLSQWVGERVPLVKEIADYNRGSQQALADVGAGMSESIARSNQEADQERRAGMSLEQQAYSDASFGDHPGRALSNLISNDIPRMAPAVAAFAANPVAGAAVFGAQGAQGGAESAGARFDQETAALSADQLNANNPAYAQLRAQGLSDVQAREALRRTAQDVGGDITGALSAATAPLAGRIPLAAIGRAQALAPAMGGQGAAAWLARRIAMMGLTGAENAGIAAASNVPGQVAADVASGQGVQAPGSYTDGLGHAFALGALFGAITPARAVQQSDFAAAAAARRADAPPASEMAPSEPAPAAPQVPVGQVPDLFGGQPREPAAPLPPQAPAPEAPAFNPAQGDLVPPVGPQLPTPRAGLIKQRAAEQAAARAAPPQEAPAGALPPPGPTEGQMGMVESARQSLAMVDNLINSGQFNPRTKSGKATLATLTAERERLQNLLTQSDNAVLGEQIGQARAARPAPEPATFTADENGQPTLPGIEPAAQSPGSPFVGEAPAGNTQPAPIGTEAPMSPQEAASRLAAQRARKPENRPPQEDLFPRNLKQSLQEIAARRSEQQVSPSTPEPAADLAAQMAALKDGSRDAVFVAAGNEAQAPKVQGKVVQKVARPEGTLYTTDRAKAKAYREAPQVDDALLAGLQDLPQPKADALRTGDDTVTQAVDQNGAVVKEALGSGNAPAVAAATPKGGAVRQVSAARAQARREALNAADQVKNRAAERAATAAVKKKVQPVLHEEVNAPKAADRASVRKAESALREDVAANHPEYAPDVTEQPEREGAGRKAESPLTSVPLTREEMGTLADRTHATAQHEASAIARGEWSPAKSVVAKVLDAAGLVPRSPGELKAAIRDMAAMEPEMLRRMLNSLGHRLGDSTFAKGIVRGMDNVRAAVHENGYQGDSLGDGGNLHLRLMDVPTGKPKAEPPQVNAEGSTDRVKLYGAMPRNVADVVGHWLKVVEKTAGRGVLPDEIHIMSPAEVNARYGTNLPEDIGGATSGEVRNPVTGKPERVVAVSWGHEGASMESLAHEMGHVISDHIYDKLPQEDRTAVNQAFKDWLDASGRLTPREQMLSRLPPAIRKLAEEANVNPTRAYASEWREWIADETAKWLLTDQKPRSAVDRFFSKIAEALKALYANVPGLGKPTEAVQRMMDNFVSNSRALREDVAAARAAQMDYGREAPEVPQGTEATRAKLGVKAVQQQATAAAKVVGEHLKNVSQGDMGAVKRDVNHLVTNLSQGRAQDLARKVKFAVSSMDDMVRSYGKRGEFGKHLVDWDTAKRLAEKDGREAQQHGQLALERAQRLAAPARRALEDLMYKATVYGVHPDAPFGKGKNSHLLDDDRAVEDSNARRYHEVKQLWDQMRGVAGDPQRVYTELRDALAELREKSFEAKRNNIDALPVSAEAKEQAHRALNAQEARTLEGPYFPLVREGSYITTAVMPAKPLGTFESRAEAVAAGRREKAVNPHAEIFAPTDNGDGTWSAHAGEKAVYFHNTEADARNARPQIEAEMREAWAHRQLDIDKAAAELGEPVISEPFTAVDFFRKAEVPQLGSFMHEVNKLNDAGKLDPEAYRRLSEMAIEALPESSPRKANLQRQNIRGANTQMLAGYGRHLLGAGHAYGQLVNGPEITRAWAGMEANRRSSPEFGEVMNDLLNRQQVLAKRMQHDPLNKFASTVQDISSFLSLGLSPAFALQQALQPLIVSAPVLAARMGADGKAVGYGKVMDALKTAYDGAAPFFGKRGAEQFSAELKRALGTYAGNGKTLQESAQDLLAKFGKTADERAMLKYLNDRGTLDFSFLNAVNDATTLSAAGSKAKAIMRLSMAFPQQIEAMNRTVTGLAAYRLAREVRGMDHADAVREANAIVSQTHGDYSRYNRPSAFNRPLLGMALQFKMYTQFVYSLFAHNIAAAMNKNLSREQRAEAVRTLGYVLGSHAVFGGAIGLGPVATAAKYALGGLMYAASGAGLIDKKKRDQTIEDWLRSEAVSLGDELLGKGNGRDLVRIGEYGAPALIGVDLANKIGIPDLTDTRFTGKPLGEDAKAGDWIDRVMLTSLGPVYSNFKRLANGTQSLANGDMGNAGKQLLPAAPRAVLSALMEAQNGVVSGNGTVIRDSKDISPYNTFLRALGIQSPETGMAYDERAARYEAKDRIQSERDALLQKYKAAKGADRAQVLKEIAAFNQDRDKAFRITPSTLASEGKRQALSPTDRAAARAIGQ